MRFAINLLPLLQAATSLRRVITVLAGTKEGSIDTGSIGITSVVNIRGHGASMVTLLLEELARQAPQVSFIHAYPGFVKSRISRGNRFMAAVGAISSTLAPWTVISTIESGERSLFLMTSARFPPSQGDAAVPLEGKVATAKGADTHVGSGVYTIDENCDSAPSKVEKLLARLRRDGLAQESWNYIESDFKRITATVVMEDIAQL